MQIDLANMNTSNAVKRPRPIKRLSAPLGNICEYSLNAIIISYLMMRFIRLIWLVLRSSDVEKQAPERQREARNQLRTCSAMSTSSLPVAK